jgi:hypothetical protein
MDWIVLLPILAFVALAAGLAVVFRGTGKIVAKSREVDGFRSAVRDLCGRVESSLEGATARIDQVRHRELDPADLTDTLTAATEAVDLYLDEARALPGPKTVAAIRDDLVAALERAGRALATVEHGTSIMTAGRGSHRELEAQTQIKRGYLNLMHAREAIAAQANRAERLGTRPDHTM